MTLAVRQKDGSLVPYPLPKKAQPPPEKLDFSRLISPIPGNVGVDIKMELGGENFKKYSVPPKEASWIAVRQLPAMVLDTMEKQKRLVKRPRECGLIPFFCCCIHHGMEIIEAYDEVIEYLELRVQFESLPQVGSAEEAMLQSSLREPLPVELGGSTVNVSVPETLKSQFSGLRLNLGITESALAVLSVMSVLATQDGVAPNYKEAMATAIARFRGMLSFKILGIRPQIEYLAQEASR